ncbi:hypothetical protein [Parvularcula marina]|uniref:hypothetical protein n=1 Tax=Parvularcula marina TaxID=2292771 RepID=UPI003517B511
MLRAFVLFVITLGIFSVIGVNLFRPVAEERAPAPDYLALCGPEYSPQTSRTYFGPKEISRPPLDGEKFEITKRSRSFEEFAARRSDAGSLGNDIYRGRGLDDYFFSGPGDDAMISGDGKDLFDAGEGDDCLISTGGHNRLISGPGSDRYIIVHAPGMSRTDIFSDFDVNRDRIILVGFDPDELSIQTMIREMEVEGGRQTAVISPTHRLIFENQEEISIRPGNFVIR